MVKYGIVFNAESMYLYQNDPKFKNIVNHSDWITCDSISLYITLLLRIKKISRIHGPDIMEHILSNKKFKKIALIGGNSKAHAAISLKYRLDGRSFFCFEKKIEDINNPSQKLIENINNFHPDVIFICLGLGRQEKYLYALKDKISSTNCLLLGTGAAVDFLGGTKKRASAFYQKIGLEWLPRLLREPRMLIRIIRSLIACLTIRKADINFLENKFIIQIDDVY